MRQLREDRGLSQVRFAGLLAISPSYLNQIERDRRPLTLTVLMRVTECFGVDPDFFAPQDTTRLIAELREALLDEEADAPVSTSELAELATKMPSVAHALIGMRRRYRDVVERTTALVDGGSAIDALLAPMPHEEARDYFYDRENYIGALDEVAERLADEIGIATGDALGAITRRLEERHRVRVVVEEPDDTTNELRRFDADARVLRLSAQLRPGQQAFQLGTQLAVLEQGELLDELAAAGRFATHEGRVLTRIGLARYYAAALLMPYRVYYEAAEVLRYDIERLANQFQVGFEVACHRLSTLQRSRLRGVPFSLVRVDRAGNMSKRQSATGFHFSRGGGTCPLWCVYEAFGVPGEIITQVTQMPDGRSYFWVARTVARKRVGYGTPTKIFSIGLGCELRQAHRLVYSDGLQLDDAAVATPIGMGCKMCERTSCAQRAFPPVGRRLEVDEDRDTFTPYTLGAAGAVR